MLTLHGIYSPAELHSRCEIILENYCKTINIEGRTMVEMARQEILPAVEAYAKELADTYSTKAAVLPGLAGSCEKDTIARLSALADEIHAATAGLELALAECKAVGDVIEASYAYRDLVLPKMAALRAACDAAETLTAKNTGHTPHTATFCSELGNKLKRG